MFLIRHIMDFGWWGRLGFLTAKKNPGLDKIQGAIHRLIRDWKFLISPSVNHKGFCVCVGGEEGPIRPALQLLRVAGWQAPGRVLTPLRLGVQCLGSPLQVAKRAPWGCDSAWVFYKSQISNRQKSAQACETWSTWTETLASLGIKLPVVGFEVKPGAGDRVFLGERQLSCGFQRLNLQVGSLNPTSGVEDVWGNLILFFFSKGW